MNFRDNIKIKGIIMKIFTTSQTFRMALYMPTEQEIASVIGERPAKRAEGARARLTEMAKNVDIYIKPVGDGQERTELGYLYIDVRNLNAPEKKPSFFSRLFNIKPTPEKLQKYREIVYHEDLADRLVKKAQILKNKIKAIR